MFEEKLREIIKDIKPADENAVKASQTRWDSLAKPVDGLGIFENMISKIAGMTGSADVRLDRKAVVIMCGDHGVVAEGVSQTDSSVTAVVASNIASGCSTVNVMASSVGADVYAVDVGISTDRESLNNDVWDYRVKSGTDNMAQGPAMSCEEACKAVIAGIETVQRLADMGYNIIASGEMGIGNTTPTAAITCVLTGLTPDEITGRGAGLSDEGLVRKKAVIKKALQINQPDKSDAIDVLSKVGGLEIAGMTGLFLGGALCRIPVIIDVSVSSAAAVLASMLCPAASDYMLASNLGKEPTAVHLNRLLGARPVICADMALGEGSGAVMLFPLLDMALNVYRRNNTFDDINITAYERFDS